MIKIFRTNVQTEYQVVEITNLLLREFHNFKISIDLEDWEKILRVQGNGFKSEDIERIVSAYGYRCEELI